MDIKQVVKLLNSISGESKLIAKGNYFFNDLKLTVASNNAMGGNGNHLAYFYCTKDVSHLIDK